MICLNLVISSSISLRNVSRLSSSDNAASLEHNVLKNPPASLVAVRGVAIVGVSGSLCDVASAASDHGVAVELLNTKIG